MISNVDNVDAKILIHRFSLIDIEANIFITKTNSCLVTFKKDMAISIYIKKFSTQIKIEGFPVLKLCHHSEHQNIINIKCLDYLTSHL